MPVPQFQVPSPPPTRRNSLRIQQNRRNQRNQRKHILSDYHPRPSYSTSALNTLSSYNYHRLYPNKHRRMSLISDTQLLAPMTQASLNRLEVATTSTASLPLSLPYYLIDDPENNGSNFNGSSASEERALVYKNQASIEKKITSQESQEVQEVQNPNHHHQQQQQQQQRSLALSPPKHDFVRIPISPVDDRFNQVPQRFSQFITDQQIPYNSQGSDNLSLLSHSDAGHKEGKDGQDRSHLSHQAHSTTQHSRLDPKSGSSSSKSKLYSSTQLPQASAIALNTPPSTNKPSKPHHQHYHHHHHHEQQQLFEPAHARNISDSMGSQATIFSTRMDPEHTANDHPLLLSSNNRPRTINSSLRKTRTLFGSKKKSKRTSTVRVYHDTTSSVASSLINTSSVQSSSSLMRKNAIRTNQGSWLYRLKLRLKKMIEKFKFYSFRASSSRKRNASIKRRKSLAKTTFETSQLRNQLRKSSTLVRKQRENPQNKDLKRIASMKLSKRAKNSPLLAGKKASSLEISTPLTNPNLGKLPVFHVAKMDQDLKNAAGIIGPPSNQLLPQSQGSGYIVETTIPRVNRLNTVNEDQNMPLSPEEIVDESAGKYKHLSKYIQQQETHYLNNIDAKTTTGSKAEPNMDISNISNISKMIADTAAAREIEEFPSPQIDGYSEFNTEPSGVSSSYQQHAPPPPPHLDHSYIDTATVAIPTASVANATLFNDENIVGSLNQHKDSTTFTELKHQHQPKIITKPLNHEYTLEQLWCSYLKQVLCKRILLRNEINQFQNFMITKETSDVINHIFEQVRVSQEESALPSRQPSKIESTNSSRVVISSNESQVEKQLENLEKKDIISEEKNKKHNEKKLEKYKNGPNHAHIEKLDTGSTSSIYSTETVSSISSETTSTISASLYSSMNEHGDIFIDPQDEEFNKRVLNRRSLLGEMLEYHSSDNYSSAESDFESVSDKGAEEAEVGEEEAKENENEKENEKENDVLDEDENEDEDDVVNKSVSDVAEQIRSSMSPSQTFQQMEGSRTSSEVFLKRYGTIVLRRSTSQIPSRQQLMKEEEFCANASVSISQQHLLADMEIETGGDVGTDLVKKSPEKGDYIEFLQQLLPLKRSQGLNHSLSQLST